MYSPQITAQLADAHRRDLIADAQTRGLAGLVRRDDRRQAPKRHARSPWARLATRLANG